MLARYLGIGTVIAGLGLSALIPPIGLSDRTPLRLVRAVAHWQNARRGIELIDLCSHIHLRLLPWLLEIRLTAQSIPNRFRLAINGDFEGVVIFAQRPPVSEMEHVDLLVVLGYGNGQFTQKTSARIMSV